MTRRQRERLHALAQSWNMPPDQVLDALLMDACLLRKLHPEKRQYASSAMPMTEAAIDSSLTRDVYVSLGEPIDRQQPFAAWAVRVYHKPFVDWIWGGCVLMALGGVLAISDRRYRRASRLRGDTPE